MAHPLFENLTRHRVREFGFWNVMMLIAAAAMLVLQTIKVREGYRPFRFEDVALFALAICTAAQAIEPAFAREHRAARVLRIVALATFVLGVAAALSMFVPTDGL